MKITLLCAMSGMLVGCASDPKQAETKSPAAPMAQPPTASAPTPAPTGRPPVILGDQPIGYAEIEPRLAEAAASVVIEEVALDRLLTKAVADNGLVVTQKDVDAERELLIQGMMSEAKMTADQAELSLANLRRGRGLGPLRFAAMLKRNAQLRAMVKGRVTLSPGEVEQGVAMEFGERWRLRVVVVNDARRAAEMRAKIGGSVQRPAAPEQKATDKKEPPKPQPFTAEQVGGLSTQMSQWALQESVDASATRGGLYESVSPKDAEMPQGLREVVTGLEVGELTPVVAVNGAYWVALVEGKTAATGTPTAADRTRVEARLQSRKERLEMDRLARQLLGSANVTVLDASMRWSWETTNGK